MRRSSFLRALVGIGTAWGATWAAVMAILAVVVWLMNRHQFPSLHFSSLPDYVISAAIFGFVLGAIAGIEFSFILAILERRRTIGTLSMWRMASWGGCSSMVLVALGLAYRPPILTLRTFAYLAMVGALGAMSAVATLSAARRGRLQSGDDAARLTAT